MATIPANPFILVDGSSYLYRAFHALPPLTNSKGQPTGAAYGFVNMLKKLLADYPTDHAAVIFDPKGKTFRDDLYKEYKANRPPMPQELSSQVQPIFDLVKAMGIPLVVVDGYEADDVIGTLAKQATEKGLHTLISTGDKDMAQLVNDQVTLINTMNNKVMDVAGVEEKFGIAPELIIDYLTLMGDSVDNIPGVPKVGPKTAVKWLKQYGSLDQIMQSADEFKGKVGEHLRNSLEHLPLSRQLATIHLDVELPIELDDLKPSEPDQEQLIDLVRKMEFKSWLKQLLSGEEEPKKVENQYTTIYSEKELADWLKKLTQAKLFAFDTETTSLNFMEAKLVGVSFAVTEHEAAYVPFAHDYPEAPTQLSREYVLEQLKPILEDPKYKKTGHNLKYDLCVLANHGITMRGVEYDSLLESYILTSANQNDLDSLALKYLGVNTIHFEDIAGKGAKQLTFNQVEIEKASPYAAEDADISLRLHNRLWARLGKEPGLKDVFSQIEMPLIPILCKMQTTGVLIDVEMLQQQSEYLGKRCKELEEKAYKQADCVFNLSSPKQLQEILFDKLGLPVIQKTPKGAPSTAEPVLQELAHDFPLPKIILEYRSLTKLKSTYTDKLPGQVNPETGRVHASFNQAGAATGRFSSTDPNLQNIPARTEEGRKIRQAFIAAPGNRILAADYSQIELRIMAHLSSDQGLLTAFANGFDIHRATAAEVFSVALDEVTDLQRRSAKAINFGLIYGMSAFGLSKQLDIERDAAQTYIDLYFARYPGVKDYMQKTRELAHEQGYVETIFGRRLYLPNINAQNKQVQMAAERAAINAPLQGTAADIIKRAMIKVDGAIAENNLASKMIMQVHDELVFEVPGDEVTQTMELIRDAMQDAAKLAVPLVVDIGVGNNWDEAH